MTLGQIADILAARGELDETLRIRQEEELLVYERLNAKRDLLVGRANVSLLLIKRNQPDDRTEARRLLTLALQVAEEMQIPEADIVRNLLAGLDADGE